jgi:hypothetical protein
MKLINLSSSALILLIVWSCSDQIRVKTDYDREVNLKLYKSYACIIAHTGCATKWMFINIAKARSSLT